MTKALRSLWTAELLCYNGESSDLTIRFFDILRKWKIKQIFFSYAYLQEY